MRLLRAYSLAFLFPTAHAYHRLKLQHWYPQYEKHWLGSAATPECARRLDEYFMNNRTECHSPCACAADCLLHNVTGTMQSSFASAQVILGLVPSVLMFIGPTIAETAVLSTSKPGLAALLALGTPTINIMRLFSQVDVREPLQRPTGKTLSILLDWLSRRNSLIRRTIRSLSYLVAVGAIANNSRTSIYLDLRTISGWKCSTLFLPLGWSLACILINIPSMAAFRCRLQGEAESGKRKAASVKWYQQIQHGTDTVFSEALFGFASVLAICHLIFGIMELSSLVFISAQDALKTLGLYVLSVFTCQCVLVFELAEMRRIST